MQTGTKLIIAAILSLSVGVCFASPMLYTNLYLKPTADMAQGPKANLNIDIVYVNFNISKNENSTSYVTYEMVLNITNPSDFGARTVYMQSSVSEDIKVVLSELVGEDPDPEWVEQKFANCTWPIIMADDFFTRSEEFDNYWAPHQSRLIMLKGTQSMGTVGVDLTIQALATEKVKLCASVYNYIDDPAVDSNTLDTFSTVMYSNQVQMQTIQQGYLYNTILSDGQTLQTDEWNSEVFIAPVS